MRLNKATESRTAIAKRPWDLLPLALIPAAACGPLKLLWNLGEYCVAILIEG